MIKTMKKAERIARIYCEELICTCTQCDIGNSEETDTSFIFYYYHIIDGTNWKIIVEKDCSSIRYERM